MMFSYLRVNSWREILASANYFCKVELLRFRLKTCLSSIWFSARMSLPSFRELNCFSPSTSLVKVWMCVLSYTTALDSEMKD